MKLPTPLDRLIAAQIRASGPITLSQYMQLCLAHPVHGYYQRADPLGAGGDFTTAPQISQLFGEMIAVWLLGAWHGLGRPDPFALIELGPGRGTLMADVLRTIRIESALATAAQVHLVETSPLLAARQVEALAPTGLAARHHTSLETLPDLPSLWLANEFFDALPTNQWVRTLKGWNARKIGLDDAGALVFGVDPTPLPAPRPVQSNLPLGTIIEHSPAQDQVMKSIAAHLARHGGAALIVDYGATSSGSGDTLQAVRAHAYADPLQQAGLCDLTTHVDFEHLAAIARTEGLPATLTTQGAFLLAHGLLERAGRLGSGASPEIQAGISSAVERLAGDAGMGNLFKVLAIGANALPPPLVAKNEPTQRSSK